jgi:hypothetical protein
MDVGAPPENVNGDLNSQIWPEGQTSHFLVQWTLPLHPCQLWVAELYNTVTGYMQLHEHVKSNRAEFGLRSARWHYRP